MVNLVPPPLEYSSVWNRKNANLLQLTLRCKFDTSIISHLLRIETNLSSENQREPFICRAMLIRVVKPGVLVGSGCFGRSRVFWTDPGVVVGSGCFGWIRVFWSDPGVLVGSGYFGQIRVFWSDPGILVGFGCFGWIRVFWSDPGVLVGSGYFGRIRMFWSDPI